MDADAHPYRRPSQPARPGGKRALDLDRAPDRLLGTREGDHEAVAMRLDDMAIVRADQIADDRVMGTEDP
jgi:hypothetical protein